MNLHSKNDMNIKKIIKTGTIVIGLSMVISGTSVFATDNNNNNNEVSEEQNLKSPNKRKRFIEKDNEKDKEKFDELEKKKTKLMEKKEREKKEIEINEKKEGKKKEGKSKKYASIYARELSYYGEDKYYAADYYAKLVTERNMSDGKARKQTDMYIEGKSKYSKFNEKALDYYAIFRFEGLNDVKAKTKVDLCLNYMMYEGKNFEYANYRADLLVKENLGEGSAEREADIYIAKLNDHSKYYAKYYAKLIVEKDCDDIQADNFASLVSDLIVELGRYNYKYDYVYDYVDYYLTLLLEGLQHEDAINQTNIYMKELENNNKYYAKDYSKECADYYVRLIFREGLLPPQARLQTDFYIKKFGSESLYADCYARFNMLGLDKKIVKERGRTIKEILGKYDKISGDYLRYCEGLVFCGKLSKEQVLSEIGIYFDQMGKYQEGIIYPDYCARHYAKLRVEEGLDDEKVEERIQTIQEILRSYPNISFDYLCYCEELIFCRNFSKEQALAEIGIYFDQMDKIQEEIIYADYYAKYYARLRVEEGLDEQQALLRAIEYFNFINKGRDDRFSSYCVKLIFERGLKSFLVEEQADAYFAEIETGREEKYADYYANLLVHRRIPEQIARKQTEIYIEIVKSDGDEEYADRYATFKCKGIKSYYTVEEQMRLYQEIKKNHKEVSSDYAEYCSELMIQRGLEETQALEETKIYFEKLSEKSDMVYADYYARLIVEEGLNDEEKATLQTEKYIDLLKKRRNPYNDYYEDYYAKLAVQKGLSHSMADKYAEKYVEERMNGRDKKYADYYIMLLCKGKNISEARKQTDIYINKIEEGKNDTYANYYAILIVDENFDELLAEKKAEFYDKFISAGKSVDYANYCVKLITEKEYSESQAIKQADIYIKEIGSQKYKSYVDCYVTLMVSKGLSKEQAKEVADIYIKKRIEKKSHEYSEHYAILVAIRKLPLEQAEKETDEYIKMLKHCDKKVLREMKYRKEMASYYARLRVERNFEEDKASKVSFDFIEKYKANGDNFNFANYCVGLMSEGNSNNCEVVEKRAKIYVQEMKKRMGHIYSDYYSMLIVERKLSEEKAKEQAIIYVQEVVKGEKDCTYADCYAFFRAILGFSDEEAREKAEKYAHQQKS